jgi:segregation and condensation protein A
MAKRGEIDPWNIDIIDLTDRFLQKISDLRVSARILLYASILLRMKAEALIAEIFKEDEKEYEEEDYYLADLDLEIDFDEELSLDGLKLGARKRIRRYTTLNELIKELRRLEKMEKKKRKRKSRIVKNVVKDIENIPHDEDVEEKIKAVNELLNKLFKSREELSFFSIVKGLSTTEILSYYVSILHLAYRSQLEVIQEKLYDDIKLRKR